MPEEEASPFAGTPCPACKAPSLERVLDKGIPFVGCTACFGLLVPDPQLGAYVEKATGKAQARQAFEDLLGKALKGKLTPGARPCPGCGAGMARFGFGEAPFVVVDRCATHGVWLDRTELKKVVRSARAHASRLGLLPPPTGKEEAAGE